MQNNPNGGDANNLPAKAPNDVCEILKLSDGVVQKVSNIVDSVNSTLVQVKTLSAQVELECAKMDHMLDALMIRAKRDQAIYQMSLPILDKQFSASQNRMDMLMMKAVEMIMTDTSDNALQKQEAVMSLIEITNQSLNNLISKLIPTT